MTTHSPPDLDCWPKRYETLLGQYIEQASKPVLERVADLARDLAAVGLPIGDLATGHMAALQQLVRRDTSTAEKPIKAATPVLRHFLETYNQELTQPAAHDRMERALRESEERFRQLAENIREVFWLSDPHAARTLYASPAFEQIWGLPRERAYAGRENWLAGIHPDDLPQVLEDLARQRRGEATEHEFRLHRPDGTVRWVRARAFPIRDAAGAVYRVAGVAEDITERKVAEGALYEVRERLELALKGAELGVWDWNIATGEVIFNERWAEMLGYALDEIEPRYDTWLQLVHPEDIPHVQSVLTDHLEGRTPFYQTEHRLRTKDGQWKWVLDSGKVFERDQDGRPLRAAGTHLDITDRKQAEEAACRHQEQLAHVSRISTVGVMASGLAHELAQPLSAILHYAHGCMGRLRAGDWGVDEATRAIEKIAVQVERAGEFVHRLKAFVRKVQPRRKPVDLNAVVRATLGFTAVEARRRRVEVELELEAGLPTTVVDEVQIEQVILNLLRNGIEALDDVEAGPRTLRVRTFRGADDTVCVSVADTGPGLAPADAEHVFDPFFTTKSDGMGLGLSISRSLIEAHEGRLWLEATQHEGAEFRFALPAERDREHDEA